MTEEWRAVPGFEGLYEVSDLGRVRSLDRVIDSPGSPRGYPRRIKGRMLRAVPRPDGYLQFSLEGEGRLAHVCVAEAFHGARPPGHVVCHGNDIRHDNRASNLSWGTPKENSRQMLERGRAAQGEKGGMAKLRTSEVLAIRAQAGTRFQKDIGADYGVGQQCIQRILARKRWIHV